MPQSLRSSGSKSAAFGEPRQEHVPRVGQPLRIRAVQLHKQLKAFAAHWPRGALHKHCWVGPL